MNNKTKIAIIIEIILVIIIIISLLDFNAECSMFECLRKMIPFIVLIITVPLAIIDLFIIQILRKKSILIPSLLTIILLIALFGTSIYENINADKPEHSLRKIINNDENKTNKYIDYTIYDNHIYYYKYKYNPNAFSEDSNSIGTLYVSDLKGKNVQKKCDLDYKVYIYLNFIYKDELYYKVEYHQNGDESSALKRLNLNNCKEETILESKVNYMEELYYLPNTIKNNTILIGYEGENPDSFEDYYEEYTYNLDTNKIIESNKDNYYHNYEGIKYNDKLINNSEDKELLSYDEKNIFLHDYKKIYTIDKETLEIIEVKDLGIKIEKTINEPKNSHYFYSNKIINNIKL